MGENQKALKTTIKVRLSINPNMQTLISLFVIISINFPLSSSLKDN